MKLYKQAKQHLLLAHPELRGESLRVLAYLETASEWHNLLPAASETAAALNLLASNVSRAYTELSRCGFIVKIGNRYHLSPMIAWTGTDKEWDSFCRVLYENREQYSTKLLT